MRNDNSISVFEGKKELPVKSNITQSIKLRNIS